MNPAKSTVSKKGPILFASVIASLLYLAAIHSLIAVMLLKTNFTDKVKTRLTGSALYSEFYVKMTTKVHKRMDGSIPSGSVLLIGDSITQAIPASAISQSIVNYGVGGDTTFGVLKRIGDYQSIERSKAVVLAVGINDLGRRDDSVILDNFDKILGLIPSHVKIVISAILPVGNNPVRNKRIVNLNGEIESLSKTYPNAMFINVGNELKNNAGDLSNDYHTGDNVHLNTKGYAILIDGLKTVALSL